MAGLKAPEIFGTDQQFTEYQVRRELPLVIIGGKPAAMVRIA
jgi:hypothetical protein